MRDANPGAGGDEPSRSVNAVVEVILYDTFSYVALEKSLAIQCSKSGGPVGFEIPPKPSSRKGGLLLLSDMNSTSVYVGKG